MPDLIYVLDADVFIQAKKGYYAFDIAPTFWQFLIDLASQNRICSIDMIKTELERGNDDLSTWANTDFAFAFNYTYEFDIQNSYREIINWVFDNLQFLDAAKHEFASDPDGWLVAYAHAKYCIVVTHELFDANIRRKVPIPNICRAFNIEYVNTFEMLRRLGFRFA